MTPGRRLLGAGIVAALTVGTAVARGKRDDGVPPLSQEHRHPSGAFTFRTPDDWTVQASPTDPDALQAGGKDVFVRFLYRGSEAGYDSLHGACMLERLAGPMATDPQVKYEYDYVSRVTATHRSLDSAFQLVYDVPILGHRAWRQRNVTVVGAGHSLCIIAYAPLDVWKKSSATRALLNGVLASVTFH